MRYYNLFKTFRFPFRYFLIKNKILKSDRHIFHTRRGIRIEVPNQLLVEFKEVFLEKSYVRHFLKLKDIRTVVDIGANVGFFTLFAANEFQACEIHAYEPIPNNFSMLKRNLAVNPGLKTHAHQVAVSSGDSDVTLQINSHDHYTTAASQPQFGRIISPAPYTPDHTIKVGALSLNSLLKKIINDIDFMKIDCEGSEYEILYNTDRSNFLRIRHLAIETHQGEKSEDNTKTLAEYLVKVGYSVLTCGQMLYCTRS